MLTCEEAPCSNRVLKRFLAMESLLPLLLSVHNRALVGETDAGRIGDREAFSIRTGIDAIRDKVTSSSVV